MLVMERAAARYRVRARILKISWIVLFMLAKFAQEFGGAELIGNAGRIIRIALARVRLQRRYAATRPDLVLPRPVSKYPEVLVPRQDVFLVHIDRALLDRVPARGQL